MSDKTISIIAVCDNHFTVLLATLLKSMEQTHRSAENIDVYIVDDSISVGNKKKITSSLDGGIINLIWLPMDDVIPKNMKIPFDRSTYPKNIHTRMFIPHFIPQHIDKIIYLDVDMILMKDISELWNIGLGDHVVAAVQDSYVQTFGHSWVGIRNYEALGFAPETKYFNSGLLIINTKKWREENCAEKVMKCISENDKFTNFPDQYGLNVILSSQWLQLDSRWNTFASDACKDPFLIHFIGRKPIYKTYINQETYYKYFYEYLNQTAWKGYKPMGEIKRYIKKISNMVQKIPEFLRK